MQTLIYGAPGAGKTTAARLLHTKTNIELYEGDYLREVKLPKEVGQSNDPFLYVGAKQAWRHFGELNAENVVKGLLAVRSSMQPYVTRELAERQDVIFEAAYLNPNEFKGGELYLVVTLYKSKHREQFFQERKFFHPKYGTKELEEGFEASRIIQDYLVKEAGALAVTLVHNDHDRDMLLSQFRTAA